ncbi:MAG: hypothetical protein AB6733_12030 [Clostridiaceae bacterium]
MKFKKNFKSLLLYNVIIVLIFIIFYKINVLNKIIRYINFETVVFKFQDLLSITITVLSVFVGAIITVATVLISMCDKRIIKLISNYDKSSYLVSSIKESIVSGIVIIVLLAIIYARIDFNIFIIRCILLYLSGILMMTFTIKSKLLIVIVLSVLNEAFKEQNHFIVDAKFKKPENNVIRKK